MMGVDTRLPWDVHIASMVYTTVALAKPSGCVQVPQLFG
jgi:hypothetical protein